MGILNKLFGDQKDSTESSTVKIDWKPLSRIEQLDEIAKETATTSVLFKHSTRCGISSSVLKQFERKNGDLNEGINYYYLDLLNHRDISAAIADNFNVIHQSPQIIVVKEGTVVAHDSHYDIVNVALEQFI